ncbi:MAG: histone deacetylase family protein [Paracoccaceae bacterium]
MRIFDTPDHARHDAQCELHNGRLVRSFECPERLTAIRTALAERGFDPPLAPDPVPRDLLERVHCPSYLGFLETAHGRWVAEHGPGEAIAYTYPVPGLRRDAPPETIAGALGHYNFSVDTTITEGSWPAALSAAAAAHAAARHTAETRAPAFALARPPGHHAHRDLYGGYCYLNNAAIAVETLLSAGASRVALLDIDYHHGNGSQAIFWERSDVLFASIHADPAREFPYFLGHAAETGGGAGAGLTLNYPLPAGTGIGPWRAALEAAAGAIGGFAAEALVVSLGVDTHREDPISRFTLETEDYPGIGARIRALGLPTVFVMEGGYAISALGANVAAVLGGFLRPEEAGR